MILFFNPIGLVLLILSFALGVAAKSAFGFESATRLCFVIGLALFFCDAAYRYFHVRPKLAEAFEWAKIQVGPWKVPPKLIWFISNEGGNFMLMPAWVFGILFALIFGTGLF